MKQEPTDIETLFKTLVHSKRIKRLKDVWAVLIVMLIVFAFLMSVGLYQIHYCEKKFPGKTIRYCVFKSVKPVSR